ncbi:MAG: hypothetical protein KBC81_01840 [Candidatus Pacebacteria bacterium]|nr:hypothetical protein [Candidatus Paceibacterota bacterium]
MNKKFFYAVAVMVGGMVGVGIFGLPYAFAQAGFWAGMGLLVAIGASTLLIDLMYGEVVLRTHEQHQIMGYARKYLGPNAQRLLFFSAILMGYVGLLAYIIISGDFLSTLLSPFFYTPVTTYSLIFASILSLAVLRGIKTISHLELFFVCLFGLVMGLILFNGFHMINPANFTALNRANFSLPYGVLLFAFGALMAVPIQRQVLVGQEHKLWRAISFSVLFTAILYAVFVTTVVGVSGIATTPDAISGLYQFLGNNITVLGSFFGVLAITTSFLMMASAMINTFHLDFKIHRFSAWLLTIAPPLILYVAGIRTFIGIISLAGGVALALEQILIIFLYAKAKQKGDRVPEYSMNIPSWLLYVLMAIFSFGIVYFLVIQ